MRNKNNNIVNINRMISIPLIIIFLAIIGMGFLTSWIGGRIIIKNSKEFGLNIAKEISTQIESNNLSLKTIDEVVADKIIIIGRTILPSCQKPSNAMLKEVSKKFDIYEINYFNSKGEIIYSNIDEYVGYKISKNHPAYYFLTLKQNEWVEKEIRKDTESNRFLRYGYVRNSDGSFIQIGIISDQIYKLKDKFDYQKQLERQKTNKNILFAVLYDDRLKEIAHINNQGLFSSNDVNNELIYALQGKTSVIENKDKLTGLRSMEVTVPISSNGEIIGVLSIGISLQGVYEILYKYLFLSFIIGIITAAITLMIINRKVKQPLISLSENILKINIEDDIEDGLPKNKQ